MVDFFQETFSVWVGVALFALMVPALWRIWTIGNMPLERFKKRYNYSPIL